MVHVLHVELELVCRAQRRYAVVGGHQLDGKTPGGDGRSAKSSAWAVKANSCWQARGAVAEGLPGIHICESVRGKCEGEGVANEGGLIANRVGHHRGMVYVLHVELELVCCAQRRRAVIRGDQLDGEISN